MDLYLSTATTLGIAAVSLLCAAGYFWLLRSRIRQLARSRRRRMGEPSGEPLHRLEVGTAVILRGKIVISSGPIERLDDGAAAAAASYSVARRQHWLARPEQMLTYHSHAGGLWLELADGRCVALRGAVVVEVGSRERRCHRRPERLAQPIKDRIFDLDPRCSRPRDDEPRYGMFRSLSAGDAVIASGVLQRDDEGAPASYRNAPVGWQLRSDGSRPLLLALDEGRPNLEVPRGSLVKAALTAAVGATLLVGFAGSTNPDCTPSGEHCLLYGTCGSRLELYGYRPGLRCVARSTDDCQSSIQCRLTGACTAAAGSCEAAADEDCRPAVACLMHGHCTAGADGSCITEQTESRSSHAATLVRAFR